MADCLTRYGVTPSRFPLEKPFAIHILAAPRRAPVILVSVLACHECEEIPTHVIVVKVRLILVLPAVDELEGKGVNQKPPYRDTPFRLPGTHHSAQGDEVPRCNLCFGFGSLQFLV